MRIKYLWKIKYYTTRWLNFVTRIWHLYIIRKLCMPQMLYVSKIPVQVDESKRERFISAGNIICTAIKRSLLYYQTVLQLAIQPRNQLVLRIWRPSERISLGILIWQINLRTKKVIPKMGKCSKNILQIRPYLLTKDIIALQMFYVKLFPRRNIEMDVCPSLSAQGIYCQTE